MHHYARRLLAGATSGAAGPSVSQLARVWDTNAGNHAVTFTPAVGDLLVAVIAGTANLTQYVSDNQSGTWYRAGWAYKGTNADMMSVYVREQKVTSAVSYTVTANQSGNTGGGIAVFALKNMTATGVNAVRQSNQGSNLATSTPSLSFGAACLTTNIVMGFFFGASSAIHNASYTEQFDESYSTPSCFWQAMSRNSGETGSSLTWGGAATGSLGIIAIEFQCSTVAVDISPDNESNSGTVGSYTFVPYGVTVTGGTATAYNWYFTGTSGGTFTINAGQGTNQATPRVTGVADPGSAYATLWCDVTVGGVVYSTRIAGSLAYDRDSGGCVGVATVTLLADPEEDA